jgi:precorrin isomerase
MNDDFGYFGKFAACLDDTLNFIHLITVPVGFVNVVESKGLILGLEIPNIVTKG